MGEESSLKERFEAYKSNSKISREWRERLEREQRELDEFRNEQSQEWANLSELLKSISQISIPQDEIYTFLNFGDEVEEVLPDVREFLEKLSDFSGSKILIWNSSGHVSENRFSLRSDKPDKRFEESLYYARIVGENPFHEFCEGGQYLNLLTSDAYKFTPSTGFTRIGEETDESFPVLDEFVECYVNGKKDGNPSLFNLLSKLPSLTKMIYNDESTRWEELSGYHLRVPIPENPETQWGRTINYDNYAKSILIVGDEMVDGFLENYDLTTLEKRTYTPSLPDI